MSRLLNICLIALLALPAVAQAGSDDEARVVTSQKDLGNCLGPVVVTHVDGRYRQLPRLGFNLEPGTHKLGGAAGESGGLCIHARKSLRSPPPIGDLEADFEAGKVYYLGLDHSSEDPADWRMRIWKVEDGQGNVILDVREAEKQSAG